MPPSSAYVKPLPKSISRFASSESELWRFRITGIPCLNLSAICCASLKLRGSTRWTRTELGPGSASTTARRPHVARLGIRPVVEVTGASTRREPAHVRPLGIRALHVLVGEVALVVPVLFLGDPEVDERLVPDVSKAHAGLMLSACADNSASPARQVSRRRGP